MKKVFVVFIICQLFFSFSFKEIDNSISSFGSKNFFNKEKYLITVNNSNQCKSCTECVDVSYLLESDSIYNHLIRAYIYKALIDGYECDLLKNENELKELYQRSSFIGIINMFFTNKCRSNIHFTGDTIKIKNNLIQLLYNNRDLNSLTVIADSLLKENRFEGLEALWDKADLSKLSELSGYISRIDTCNFFIYANLAAFYHVNEDYKDRDIFLNRARRKNKFRKQYNALKKLIKDNKNFDVILYKEIVYGGM